MHSVICCDHPPCTLMVSQRIKVDLTWITKPAEIPATAPCGGQKLPSQLCAELAPASTTLIGLSATHSGRGFSLWRLLWGYSSTLSLYWPADVARMLTMLDLPPACNVATSHLPPIYMGMPKPKRMDP